MTDPIPSSLSLALEKCEQLQHRVQELEREIETCGIIAVMCPSCLRISAPLPAAPAESRCFPQDCDPSCPGPKP